MDCLTPSSMASSNKLHIAMYPWLAFGHIIPFLELAKLIAQKGHLVSFISSPRNIERIPKLPPNLASLINLVKLPLPHEEKLPQNAEATIDVTFHQVPYLKKAYDGQQESLASFLETSMPDWIIYDFAPHWLPPIAAKFGISCAFFNILTAWSICLFGPSSAAMMNGDDPRTELEHFITPQWVPFDTKVAFRLDEAKRFLVACQVNISGVSDMYRCGSVIAGCDVFISRSCMELETEWLSLLKELHQKPVVPVGLLPRLVVEASGEEDEDDDVWHTIKRWLDKQKNESVVYVAFGSEVTLSQDDLTELALGLELSGLPFFWALRRQPSSVELPDGFEDRTKGQGVVWISWAPQLKILGHEAVGGFLTHCGWSSIIEGLQFGRALIMLPFLLDQGLNARVFEEKKVGVEIPRSEKDGSFTRNSIAKSMRMVMVDEEGNTYMDNAKKMKKIFGDKELHDKYVDDFVKYLQNHKRPTDANNA